MAGASARAPSDQVQAAGAMRSQVLAGVRSGDDCAEEEVSPKGKVPSSSSQLHENTSSALQPMYVHCTVRSMQYSIRCAMYCILHTTRFRLHTTTNMPMSMFACACSTTLPYYILHTAVGVAEG